MEIGVVKGRAHRVFFVALKVRRERVEMVAPLAAQQVLDMASSIRRLQSRGYNEDPGYFRSRAVENLLMKLTGLTTYDSRYLLFRAKMGEV